MDSYKLVRFKAVSGTIVFGAVVAVACSFLNYWIRLLFHMEFWLYARSVAPLIEELAKASFLIYLIRSGRVGFMVDGAIYGFAAGAGFAFVENLYYFYSLNEAHLFVWIIRGFGTAVMHGGTTAIFAIISKGLLERNPAEKLYNLVPGFLLAVALHALYNQFLLGPVVNTLIILLALPVLIFVAYSRSEAKLREWLEVGFDADAFLLEMIDSGNITRTKLGRFLLGLKEHFPGERVADMLCFIRIHLELTMRAKGILLLRQAGFEPAMDPELGAKFEELSFLEKSIGKTGKLAILPLIYTSSRELWQMYMLAAQK